MIKEAYDCGQRHFGENYVSVGFQLVKMSPSSDAKLAMLQLRFNSRKTQ